MFDTSQDIHGHIPLTYPNTHKHTKLYMHIYKYKFNLHNYYAEHLI